MHTDRPLDAAPLVPVKLPDSSLLSEFVMQQLPLIVVMIGLGFASAWLQYGYLPGADTPFPLAGVRVPIWHLIWMGFWTGYTMAIVGEAAGIFVLPYQISILHFENAAVTPTTQLITFLNPIGALLGFRRTGQWNLDFARWVCLGGFVGGFVGPFIRLTVLADSRPFTLAVGFALAIAGLHLCLSALGVFKIKDPIGQKFAAAAAAQRAARLSPAGLPKGLRVETLAKGGGSLTIGFWGERWTMNTRLLFFVGFGVASVATALGVGGGFLLVPIFAALYHLPMYVLVAASIPFVIVLSGVGIFTYIVIIPIFVGTSLPPEFAWGFFAAAGGSFGAWCAAKTQRFVPQHFLKLMLGGITGAAGLLYITDFFFKLPFRI